MPMESVYRQRRRRCFWTSGKVRKPPAPAPPAPPASTADRSRAALADRLPGACGATGTAAWVDAPGPPLDRPLFCCLAFEGRYTGEALFGGRLNLAPWPGMEPGALVGRAFAHVGVAVGAQHVDGARDRLAGRALAGHQDDARLDVLAHLQHQADRAAVVEQPHLVALLEAAPAGVLGIEHAERLALALAQEADARKGGMGLEVARRGQQPQRPLGGLGGFEGILVPVRHRRDALFCKLLGIEFELARRRLERLAVPIVRDRDRHAGKQLGRRGPGR